MNDDTIRPLQPQPPPSPEELSRRKFLERLSLALGGVVTAGLAAPVIGFIVGPLLQPYPQIWEPVGTAADFKVGQTVAVRFEDSAALDWAGVTARTAAWLRRESETEFIAFSINCTHLGCPVRWLPQANLFMCPCHGGVFYKDGTVAAGPPPRPLTRYAVRVINGVVELRTAPIAIT